MKQYQLPRDFAEKWVKALRSGEYKQGKCYLAANEKLCCLGVAGCACDIPIDAMEYFKDFTNMKIREIEHIIPGELIGTELSTELVNLNDNLNNTFPEIADWIEQNVQFI